MSGPMLPDEPATFVAVATILIDAFATARDQLDAFASEQALMSDEIMGLLNRMHTDFAPYYAKHIQDGWDWENAETLDVDPVDETERDKANARASLTHATESRDA